MISRSKCQVDTLTFEKVKNEFDVIQQIECYYAHKENKIAQYNSKWLNVPNDNFMLTQDFVQEYIHRM